MRAEAEVRVTTDSHDRRVYPNLARRWCSPSATSFGSPTSPTFGLRTEFVYLAVVLDAFSRRVIGWALERTLEAELALRRCAWRYPAATATRSSASLRSRRAVCFAGDYTEMLKQHHADISMSRKGNPYDNAACESFMKTLKQEEVYRNEYRDFAEARSGIGEFLERVYNRKRLHSALGLSAARGVRQDGTCRERFPHEFFEELRRSINSRGRKAGVRMPLVVIRWPSSFG